MGLELSQGMEISLDLSPSQILDLKLSLSQKLSIEMLDLLDSSADNPEATLEVVLQQICEAIDNEEIQKCFEAVFSLELLRTILIKDHLQLSVISDKAIYDLVLNFFIAMYKDGFPDLSEHKQGILHQKVSSGVMLKTFLNSKEKNESELEVLKDHLRSQRDSTGTLNAFNELSTAIKIVDQYTDQVENMYRIIFHACQVNDQILISFFRDLVMVKQLNLIFADKIQKRFVKRFRRVKKFDDRKSLANEMLNTIAEYVLVGMGIISPKLFSLRSFQQDPQHHRDFDERLRGSGLTARQLLHHYNLQTTGTVFFHRWHVLGHKPTRITDNLIRLFITKTIRQSADDLFDALEFESLIEDIKNLKRDKLKPAELDVEIRDLLVKAFTEYEFVSLVKEKIKNDWYKHLVIFIQEAPEN